MKPQKPVKHERVSLCRWSVTRCHSAANCWMVKVFSFLRSLLVNVGQSVLIFNSTPTHQPHRPPSPGSLTGQGSFSVTWSVCRPITQTGPSPAPPFPSAPASHKPAPRSVSQSHADVWGTAVLELPWQQARVSPLVFYRSLLSPRLFLSV